VKLPLNEFTEPAVQFIVAEPIVSNRPLDDV
jgi:hypothetical protein